MSSPAEWVVDLAEDIEIPGWFFVPEAPEDEQQRRWVEECAEALSSVVGSERWDGGVASELDIHEVLRQALDERAATDSDAVFQVWPLDFMAAVMCHVNLVTSASLPSWTDTGAIVHRVEAPHLGAGLQCSTRRTDDDSGMDVVSVHLIFDNGDVALMLSLGEAPAPLITRVLPEFMMLTEALRIDRADGAPFIAVAPEGQFDEPPWPFEEAG
ncbi:hypothetical protein [Georgenia halophila]